jgi:hypothetical protein
MQATEYDRIAADLLATAKRIADSKRPAYTVGSPDVLANFKRIGDRTTLGPLKVLDVYLLKHIDSITAYSDGDIEQSEPIEGRFADAINYLLLKYALLVERRDTNPPYFDEMETQTS